MKTRTDNSCCGKAKNVWYYIIENEALVMCANWKPHDKTKFIKLGKL